MSIIEKVNARLKFLYRHKKHLDFKCRQLLSSALIQCYFDYACSSWYAGLTKTFKNKLQVTQNKVVRFILDLEQRASVNNHVLERAKMLCVSDRVKQLRLNHVYHIVHGTAPQYMFYNFIYVNQTIMCITQGQVVIILCNHPSGVKNMDLFFFYKCHQRLEQSPWQCQRGKEQSEF